MDISTLRSFRQRIKKISSAIPYLKVKPGWIYYTRRNFHLTLKELGDRARIAPSTIAQAERREAQGKVTVETLRKIADAMECDFVYAFVPRTDPKKFLRRVATEKAKKILGSADTHMSLEDQKVKLNFNQRLKRLVDKLIATGDIW